jgi:hypothetical protein
LLSISSEPASPHHSVDPCSVQCEEHALIPRSFTPATSISQYSYLAFKPRDPNRS